MITYALDHGDRARVADSETFAADAAEEGFTGNGAVENGVADDDIVGGDALGICWRTDDNAATRQALAHIVVRVTGQVQRHAMRQESAEALARNTLQLHQNAIVGQAGMAEAASDFARKHRADRTIDVADRPFDANRLALFQRIHRCLDQILIKCRIQAMFLAFRVAKDQILIRRDLMEEAA